MTLSTTNKNRYQGIINDKSSYETQSRKKDNYSVTKILQKSKKFIINPNSPYKISWDLFVIILIMYDVIDVFFYIRFLYQ